MTNNTTSTSDMCRYNLKNFFEDLWWMHPRGILNQTLRCLWRLLALEEFFPSYKTNLAISSILAFLVGTSKHLFPYLSWLRSLVVEFLEIEILCPNTKEVIWRFMVLENSKIASLTQYTQVLWDIQSNLPNPEFYLLQLNQSHWPWDFQNQQEAHREILIEWQK